MQSSGVGLQEAYSLAKGKDKNLPVGKVGLVVRSLNAARVETLVGEYRERIRRDVLAFVPPPARPGD